MSKKNSGSRKNDRYEVGYRKPPLHSRFKPGESGNPSGRRHKKQEEGIDGLIMKEAFRLIKIREGDKVLTIPAIQAVLRSQINIAAKGNNRAQQNLIDVVQSIERPLIAQADLEEAERAKLSEIDVARRVAFLLERGKRSVDKQVLKKSSRSDKEK